MRATTIVFIGTIVACAVLCGADKIIEESGSCGDNVFWTIVPLSKTLVISGSGAMTDFNSPEDVPWSNLRTEFDKVVIRPGVTSIGKFAFSNCTGVTSVEIANSVSVIRSYAFMACSGLTSINIPKSVLSIEEYAFYSCLRLKALILPRGVERISAYAFAECVRLAGVSIPSTVRLIGEHAFENCIGLLSVIYRGMHNPESTLDVFNGCKAKVFVPLDYEDPLFCGVRVRIQKPPQEIFAQQNSCYEVLSCADSFSVVKSEEFIDWEQSAEGCHIHSCDNRTGLIRKDACALGNPLSACFLSECQSDGTCSNISLYNGTVGGCVESVECDPHKGWVETGINCTDIILRQELGIVPETASCYIFSCSGNGTCKYSPKRSCGKLCHRLLDARCEHEVFAKKGCVTSSRCVEVISNGLWKTECEHDFVAIGDSIPENECYERVCQKPGIFVSMMTEKAMSWESQLNGCFEYHCDNRTGFISWSTCNSTKGVTRVCSADKFQCKEIGGKKPPRPLEKGSSSSSDKIKESDPKDDSDDDSVVDIEDLYKIVVELDSNSTDFDLEKFMKRLLQKTDIDPEKVNFGAKVSDNGKYASIIITVPTKNDAQIIADTVNHDEETGYVKSAYIEGRSLIAKASHIEELMFFIISTLVIAISSAF